MVNNYDELREDALYQLRAYMDSLDKKKGCVLAYWVRDYVRFLRKEAKFDPKKLIRYKRGSIVKAHLGFRIGSEEGGLHYAVVLDSANALSSQTVTVIPLTSQKPTSKPHPSKVSLGDEIYQLVQSKIRKTVSEVTQLQSGIQNHIRAMRDSADIDPSVLEVEQRLLTAEVEKLNKKLDLANNMLRDIYKMKEGSIALVGQITTISKIRIYDPMYPLDTLSGIRLSSESMDKLDAKLQELYTKKSK